MTSTAESIFEKAKSEQSRRIFEAMAEDFFKRWQPDDPYEASQFSAQLFTLVRQIYIEAQEPLAKQIHDIIKCLPFPQVFK